MTIIITLSFAGNETGPFDLYSDATNFATPFAQGITKAALLAGFQVDAPAGTTVVRLDDLSGLCLNTKTDIYTCATPNCDFAGEILCNITTTTTTSTPPTTTTTTSYFPNPFDVPCLWSTNGGNPGLIAVYDFETNTSTDVFVPNDFTTTVGINRPICATEDKLWLSDGLNYNDDTSGNPNPLGDYSFIREYDISTTSGVTLTYVREIRVDVGQAHGNAEGAIKTISVVVTPPVIVPIEPSYPPIPAYWPTSDFPYLLVGAQSATKVEVVGWDISTTGDIRLARQAIQGWIPRLSYNQIQTTSNTNTTSLDLTGMFITTDNNVFIASRFNGSIESYNQLQELNGLPPFNINETQSWPSPSVVNWTSISSQTGFLPVINLQEQGIPEFTTSWAGIKAMPSWGIDELLQVLQPETNQVYTISQTPDYEATIATSVIDYNVWLSSATGCANVGLLTPDAIDGCEPTALPILVESNYSDYIGPITFTYAGMSVIASSTVIEGLLATGNGGFPFTTDCGIGIPAGTQTMYGNTNGASLSNPAFSYTLEFPVPVNNIPLRVAVLDPNDNFRFTTNSLSTTISITSGCQATVQNGNDLITDITASGGAGSVEVLVTGSQAFTILTFVGTNQGFGGPWALGCNTPPLDCNLIYPDSSTLTGCSGNPGVCYPGFGGFQRIYAWNPISFVRQEIVLPPGSYMSYPNFAVSENYLIADLNNWPFLTGNITRYGYTLGASGVPENVTWDEIFYSYPTEWEQFTDTMEAINDTKFVGLWQNSSESKVLEIEIIAGTTELQVTEKWENTDFRLTGDVLITLKEDGTPNKLIAPSLPFGSSFPETGNLKQFDYLTGALEGTLDLPTGIRSTASIGMIGQYIYISVRADQIIDPSLHNLWRVDISTSIWSIVPQGQAPVEFTNGGAADFGSRLECRTSDGLTKFTPDTTTTTTTPDPSGTKTIWTWFESELNS